LGGDREAHHILGNVWPGRSLAALGLGCGGTASVAATTAAVPSDSVRAKVLNAHALGLYAFKYVVAEQSYVPTAAPPKHSVSTIIRTF